MAAFAAAYAADAGVGGWLAAGAWETISSIPFVYGAYLANKHLQNVPPTEKNTKLKALMAKRLRRSRTKSTRKAATGTTTLARAMRKKYGKVRVTRGVTMAPEIKHWAPALMSIAIPGTAGGSAVCTALGPFSQQGTDFANRIGRKLRVIGVEMMCRLALNAANIFTIGDTVRCQVWLDKECRGALAAPTDIYVDSTLQSLTNPSNLRRFKLLHTHNCSIAPTSVNAGVVDALATMNTVHIKFKCNFEVNYINNNADVTSIIDNLLIIHIACGQGGVAGASPGNMDVRHRVTFVDV